MTNTHTNFFIEPEELASMIASPSLRLVDGSWYLPAMGRDGKAEYDMARIPNAGYFDINAIADLSTNLPHMLPSPELFSEAVGKMGISQDDDIVVYDGPGLFSSARVWWTFRVMGAKHVRILAGGIDGWKKAGLPLETGKPKPPTQAEFKTEFNANQVRDFDYMLANIKRGKTLVLDARPYGRFTGEITEPRAGLRGGHIPGSKSMAAMDIINAGRLLPAEELQSKLENLGAFHAEHVTTSCGSGVTAAILSLALATVGHKNHSLYDGSWADWERPSGLWVDVRIAASLVFASCRVWLHICRLCQRN